MASARWSTNDEALVPTGSIAASRDPRSVGEMLDDVDRLSRRLLFDVTADDAATFLRAWPPFVSASGRLWRSLPTRTLPHGGRSQGAVGEVGFSMLRIHARTEALAAGLGSESVQHWPGPGTLHAQLQEMTTTLDRAAQLVGRWSGDVQLLRPEVRADVDAARVRVMHSVWVGAHTGIVALQLRGRELATGVHGRRVATSPTRAPFVVAPIASWVRRLEGCERAAADYLARADGHTPPTTRAVGGDDLDPDRLSRALLSWELHAHRVVAKHPTPADLTLVARTQADLARSVHAFLPRPSDGVTSEEGVDGASRGSAAPRDPSHALEAVEDSRRAWASLATRWKDLAPAGAPPAGVLLEAAAELRAAISQATTTTGVPGLSTSEATVVVCTAVRAAAELAPEVAGQAARLDLSGPARALSRRVCEEVDMRQVHDRQGAIGPGRDTVWVLPADIAANRLVPAPRPLVDGLRRCSRDVVGSTSRAAVCVAVMNARREGVRNSHGSAEGRLVRADVAVRGGSPTGPTLGR